MKPFDLEELVLRIENIARRNGKSPTLSTKNIIIDSLDIDTQAKSVKKDGKRIELSPKEYSLLEVLLKNRGTVLSRDFLYEAVW